MRRPLNDPRTRCPRLRLCLCLRRRASAALAALALVGTAAALSPALAQLPGPESFAKEPRTPTELWDAVDYLVRVGQADAAVPYLRKFLASNPDDATLLEIRGRYGVGTVLRLDEFPDTKPLVRPLLERFAAASRRSATQPGRLQGAIAGLTRTRPEQDYGVERLREAGPNAVPAVIAALNDASRSGEDRALIAANLGRLDHSAVPPLIAVLDSPDAVLATDAAEALGRIGDPRAIPALTYASARKDKGAGESPQEAARGAIARLTGRPFSQQTRTAARVLADEARKYLIHAVRFPGDTVELWEWEGDRPAPRTVPSSEAEGILGLRYARQALAIDPADARAQATFVALALEKAVARVGLDRFPAEDPTGAWPTALAAGPDVLGEVLRVAIADGHSELASAAAMALGRVVNRDSLTAGRRPSPLVEALSAPDRRAQFAAAKALVELEPARPFPGSSRVVPTLARFVGDAPAPQAVVIDGNLNRGNRVASMVSNLGYDPTTVERGDQGFQLAAESAGVEAIFLEPSGLQGAWGVRQTLANLRADARTAGLPVFLLLPEDPRAEQTYLDRGRELTRTEREPNDEPGQAQPLIVAPDTRRARVQGSLPAADAQGDYYRLGPLRPGTTVLGHVSLPSVSTLNPGEALLTLEREILVGPRREPRGFTVAESRAGRLAYLIPAAPEPAPKDNKAEAQRAADRKAAEAKGQPFFDTPPEPPAYGDYLLHIRPTLPIGREGAPARERGALPRYILDVAQLQKVATTPGTSAVRERLEDDQASFPRVAILVPTTDANLWKRQVDAAMARMGALPLSAAERDAFAKGAAALLARIASRPGSPLAGGLDRAGPALTGALNSAAGVAASEALGDVPGIEAQRGLADAAIDPSRPDNLRRRAAEALARSLQRFGPLIAADQEPKLLEALDRESDPAVRAALAAALGALRPRPALVGRRLPAYRLAPAAQP